MAVRGGKQQSAVGVTPRPSAAMSESDVGEDLQVLASRAVQGDAAATERLLKIVHRIVRRYCRARLARFPGADHTADDVAQEVCIAVLSALSRYRDEGRPFEAFVYRIAANKVADAQRAFYRSAVPYAELPDGPETPHRWNMPDQDEDNGRLDDAADERRHRDLMQ